MGKRHPNHRLAKIHRSYPVAALVDLFDVHENTIRAWRSAGMEPIDASVPMMFKGDEIQRFLIARRKAAKRPCDPGQIYCVPCRAHRRPAGDMAEYVASGVTSGNLSAICPVCDRLMNRAIRRDRISVEMPGIDVSFTEASPRIRECAHLAVNCDSETGVKI